MSEMVKLLLATLLVTPVLMGTTACGGGCANGYYTAAEVEQFREDLLTPTIDEGETFEVPGYGDPNEYLQDVYGMSEEEFAAVCEFLEYFDWRVFGPLKKSDVDPAVREIANDGLHTIAVVVRSQIHVYRTHLTPEEQEAISSSDVSSAADWVEGAHPRYADITAALMRAVCQGC